MKTYDEYIQARILKVYTENKRQFMTTGACKTFDDYVESGYVSHAGLEKIADWLVSFGCGKQRAKDYAHYIKNYLATTVKVK